jgi:hypothetical protein
MEDDDDAYFTDIADHQPFRLGHEMKVIGIVLHMTVFRCRCTPAGEK